MKKSSFLTIGLMVVVFLLGSQIFYAQGNIVEDRIKALHQAIQSSEKQEWEKFITENYCLSLLRSRSMADHLDMFSKMHEGCGECAIMDVEVQPGNLRMEIFTGTNNLIFQMDLEESEEHRFCGFNIEEAPGLSPITMVDLRSDKFKNQVAQLIQQNLDLDIFSGVVLIADHGNPVIQEAYGYADREKKIKNTPQTLFDIGSMNKTFTKVVVYQLVNEGKLKFENNLGQFLKGWSDPRANEITIRQLLDHSSGMGDYHDRAFFELPSNQRTRKHIVDKIKSMPLEFDPGDDRSYSNSGYVILGAVIEKVSGKSYFQNVRDRIVDPLKLKNTYLENLEVHRNNRATGYYKTPFGEIHSNDNFMDIANADGGFLSTVQDIMTFYRSYYYDHLLIPERMKQDDPAFQFYQNLPEGRATMAAGGYESFNTALYQVYKDDVSIIVFSNMDEPAGEQLASGLLDLARGENPPKPALPAKMNVLQAYRGKGIAYVKEHFDELTTNYHPADPKEWILNDLGYAFLYQKADIESALDMFRVNTELFPDNANTWDSLGEAWLKKGNKEKALQFYQKALELDPQLESARKAINNIEK